MANKAIDPKLMQDIKDHATQLRNEYVARDALFRLYNTAYLLNPAEDLFGNQVDKAKVVLSPDARNTVLGIVRLMVATDPTFSIAFDKANAKEKAIAEKLEKMITRMYDQSGRISGNPVHYDAVLSAALYGEMHMAITSTADLLKMAEQQYKVGAPEETMRKQKGAILRAQRTHELTPFLWESWQPVGGYPEFDMHGQLSGYYHVRMTNPAQLIRDFGSRVPRNIRTMSRYFPVELHEFYDLDYKAVWVSQGDILLEEHGLPLIPISVQITEGSRLFDRPEEQRQPILYGLIKSKLWNAQNIAMSVLFTLVYGMGVSPMFIHTAPPSNPDKELVLNFNKPGGVVELEAGEQFQSLQNKGIIDPSFAAAMELAERKGTESTIYRQALGEPVGRNTTFSETNMLAQTGRLPLTSIQKRGAWGISSAIETALLMFRTTESAYKGRELELNPTEIPNTIQIDTRLEVSLPQDQLQLANIARMIATGDDPLVSRRWAREKVLNINNPEEIETEIWGERAGFIRFNKMAEDVIQEMAMKKQQAEAEAAAAKQQQQGGPEQLPPQQLQMGEMPNMPPSGAPNMPQAPAAGEVEGMPPEQAGMIPGGGYA